MLDRTNTVVGLIRSQTTADALNELAKQNSKVPAVETDIFNPESLREAVTKVGKIMSEKVDVLIHNAYSAGTSSMFLTASQLYVDLAEIC